MPLLININTKISVKKNSIIIPDDFPFLGFRFGIGGSKGIPVLSKNSLIIKNNATLILKGKCHISNGSSIRIDEGNVELGKGFSANKNFLLTTSKGVTIKEDVTCGWNVSIRDSDGHFLYYDGKRVKNKEIVLIDKGCWINSWTDILKGTKLDEGCVVAYRSLVTSKTSQFETKYALIGGHPAKIIRKNIFWEK